MKKIVIVSSMIVLSLLFASNSEINSSKESNITLEKETKVKKPLDIDLDKFKKKDGLKGGKSNPIKGTLKYNDNNDEVAYYPPQGDNNDEVIYVGDSKVCLVGTRKTLFKGDFKLSIINGGKPIFSYPKDYQNRKICISVKEIKKGNLLLVKDAFGNDSVKMKIEKL